MNEKIIILEQLSENYFTLNHLKQQITNKNFIIKPNLIYKQIKKSNLISFNPFQITLNSKGQWKKYFKKYFKNNVLIFSNYSKNLNIKKKYFQNSKIIRNIYLKNFFLIKKLKNKKKIPKQKLIFTKLIIKDIITQTWEKNMERFLINKQLQLCFIFKKTENSITDKNLPNLFIGSFLNYNIFNWIIKNT